MGLGANDIYRWKAVDLSFSDVRVKIDFLQPSDRQNFANALGQTCIHDLRLRHKKRWGQKFYQFIISFSKDLAAI